MKGLILKPDEQATVRVRSVDIENFKSVRKGHIDFVSPVRGGASITGVYGQNGSGKTALIDAMSILQRILSGQSLGPEAAEKSA